MISEPSETGETSLTRKQKTVPYMMVKMMHPFYYRYYFISN